MKPIKKCLNHSCEYKSKCERYIEKLTFGLEYLNINNIDGYKCHYFKRKEVK